MFARSATRVFAARSAARTWASTRAGAVRTMATQAGARPAPTAAAVGLLAAATAAAYMATANQQLVLAEAPKAATPTIAGVEGTVTERTFMAVKPDGVQRGLVGEIISRMEKKGYKLVGLKLLQPSEALAREHYDDLKERPFFAGLVAFMTSGPVVGMVWEGPGVIKMARSMIGATNPLASAPGTIRGDLAVSVGRNIIHGSDSFETAKAEIGLWFKASELVAWERSAESWITSNN